MGSERQMPDRVTLFLLDSDNAYWFRAAAPEADTQYQGEPLGEYVRVAAATEEPNPNLCPDCGADLGAVGPHACFCAAARASGEGASEPGNGTGIPDVGNSISGQHTLAVVRAAVKAERTGRWSGLVAALRAARAEGMEWAGEEPSRAGMLPGAWRNYEDGGKP